jgi:hypothetical protein
MEQIVDGSQMAAADLREVERLSGSAVDRSINGASSVVSSETGAMMQRLAIDRLINCVCLSVPRQVP